MSLAGSGQARSKLGTAIPTQLKLEAAEREQIHARLVSHIVNGHVSQPAFGRGHDSDVFLLDASWAS